jgi:hypothetical protein
MVMSVRVSNVRFRKFALEVSGNDEMGVYLWFQQELRLQSQHVVEDEQSYGVDVGGPFVVGQDERPRIVGAVHREDRRQTEVPGVGAVAVEELLRPLELITVKDDQMDYHHDHQTSHHYGEPFAQLLAASPPSCRRQEDEKVESSRHRRSQNGGDTQGYQHRVLPHRHEQRKLLFARLGLAGEILLVLHHFDRPLLQELVTRDVRPDRRHHHHDLRRDPRDHDDRFHRVQSDQTDVSQDLLQQFARFQEVTVRGHRQQDYLESQLPHGGQDGGGDQELEVDAGGARHRAGGGDGNAWQEKEEEEVNG